MKRLLVWIICISALSASAHAQATDTFDIATFKAPAGWTQKTHEGGILFSIGDKPTNKYAVILLYKSDSGLADAKANFDADWKRLVVDTLELQSTAKMEPLAQTNGWAVLTGSGTFQNEMGTSAVILSTYSGFGKKFSVAALFNSPDYAPAIDAFASSIVLSKPFADAPTATTAPPAEILGTWGSNVGASMTYGDPVAAGMAGYTKSQYTLNADGTYVFNSKTFRMGYDKIILVRESGTYQINGSNLTIKPQKSVIQAWSKLNGVDKFGRLLSTQPRKLETVTYKFTKHYFSGIQEWNLVLQADQPTERDGPFSTFTAFPNAWYYKTISSNNPVIELPK